MTDSPSGPRARFVRLAETDRPAVSFSVDGLPATAMRGDTLLVALLNHRRDLRRSEFGDGPRAGFCLMGACQDCWIWREDGVRLRACSTPVEEGMAVRTAPPVSYWPETLDLVLVRERERERERLRSL
ncbi:2Fe-2S ferredoxin [Roseateles aquatilis]|uniref:2Fe-2S ferredoxin n=1 Tax=Roseateles aquatilis TaxID=431061 RepID=A0A246IU74_9BURK|nr:(2Fe-2S)-binding protein [Roseateles aquatilis]OWQ83765.1 2Fe-2S ferredoxin [Roseateles aquatilis]